MRLTKALLPCTINSFSFIILIQMCQNYHEFLQFYIMPTTYLNNMEKGTQRIQCTQRVHNIILLL